MIKDDFITQEDIREHIENMSEPITATEIALAFNISFQKAKVLLMRLCSERSIKCVPYRTKTGYISADMISYYHYSISTNEDNNIIKVDWEVDDGNIIDFELDKPISYKEKIFKIIYEIILDYFF